MPKLTLTASSCLTAQCQPTKKRTDYYDTVCTGFTLECHRSGTKTYTFRYQDAHGLQTQRRIGGYGDISFAQAQKAAKKFRAEVTMGGNPAAAKAEKKAVVTAPGEVF